MPSLTGPLFVDGLNVGALGPLLVSQGKGKRFYADYVNGNDANDGLAPSDEGHGHGPVKNLSTGYGLMTSGANDILFLLSNTNSATTDTFRISAAFDWAKDNCHLIGICSGAPFSHRARISNLSTYLPAAGTNPLVTISGNNCVWANVQIWYGSGVASQDDINVLISGQRNVFANVHFAGHGHATQAARATNKNVDLTGSENLFRGCMFGVDTVVRAAANSSVILSGSDSPRNVFEDCWFVCRASAGTPKHVTCSGTGCLNGGMMLFKGCVFINAATPSGATQLTGAIATATAANGDVCLIDCWTNAADWHTTSTPSNLFVGSAVATAGTTGLVVNPTT